MSLRYPILAVAVGASLFTACGGGAERDANTVAVSGSTTVLPAVSLAADQYTASGDVRVVVNAGGSGSGFNQLAQGQTDIGMMSRDITAEERAKFSDIEFTEIAIGRDAVIPVISSEIYDAGVTEISLTQLADIYAGRVDNWSALGGPNKAIFTIDKEPGRGTRQVFMQVVTGDKLFHADGADLVIGANNESQTAVAQSDSAIAALSIAWINADVKGLTLVLNNGTKLAPNLKTLKSGNYPISRDLTVVTRSDILPAAQAFIDFILSEDGQKHVVESGYVAVK